MPSAVGDVAIVPAPADDPASLALIAELDAELAETTPREHMHGLHPGEARAPALRFFHLLVDGEPAGCGALRVLEPGVAELKRMLVRKPYRRRGLARALVDHLEREATRLGVRTLRLETGKDMPAAQALYRGAGYRDIPPYGEYVGSPISVCMEKIL